MKKYFLLLIIFFFSISTSNSVDWLPQNDGLEVDYHSIVKSRTSITGWIKDYNRGQYDRRNLKKVSYVMYHSTAFCSEKKLKNLQVSYYDRKGRLIDTELLNNIHYFRVIPNSLNDKLFRALCTF